MVFDEGFKASTLVWKSESGSEWGGRGVEGGRGRNTPKGGGAFRYVGRTRGSRCGLCLAGSLGVERKGGSGKPSPLNDTPPSGDPIAMRGGGVNCN